MIDDSEQPEISFATIWAFMVRHRLILWTCAIIGACGFGAIRLFKAREYTAFASFIPRTKHAMSSAANLAAQFGLAGLGTDRSESPQFFADLVNAPTVLRQVVTSRYTFPVNGKIRTGSLVEAYDARGDNAAQRIEDAAKTLSDNVESRVSQKTGLISLNVSASSGDLAVQIAQQILSRVNAINLQLRQSEAIADRQFSEEQVAELTTLMRAAENKLQSFMQENRDYRTSPRLQMEQDRLSREVSMRQNVYETMASSYDQARIESARDNPIIEVIDTPILPSRPDRRGLGKGIIGGFILGALLGFLIGGVTDVWARRGLVS